MKMALITDQHFGARDSSFAFDSFFEKFYRDVFFPELDKRGITTVFDLGDTFDRRKYVNYGILYNTRRYWFSELRKRDIDFHSLVGNHTAYYKNTNRINSLTELYTKNTEMAIDGLKLTVYPDPCHVTFDGTQIALIPWINSENYKQTMDMIATSPADVAFGHLELNGFEMYRGERCHNGMDSRLFERFDKILSGHFHHRADNGQFYYLGNPYQITWGDYGDVRGFHIFDTSTRSLEFIKNPYDMFHKITYDDSKEFTFEFMKSLDLSIYTGKYIKIIVVNKQNPYLFDTFLENIHKVEPIDVNVVEDFSELLSSDEDSIDQADDTMTVLSKYVDGMNLELIDTDRLKNVLRNVYVEAVNLEQV